MKMYIFYCVLALWANFEQNIEIIKKLYFLSYDAIDLGVWVM